MRDRIVYIQYCKIPDALSNEKINWFLSGMPDEVRTRFFEYKMLSDKLLFLYGRLLLINCLKKYGINSDCLANIKYNEFSRPFIDSSIDFNISHSGNYVVCAICNIGRLGIDIEQIKPIKFEEYSETMNPGQWEIIEQSTDPLRTFYTYWAIKESVIKADSRGMSIPLQQINISKSVATCMGAEWNYKTMMIDKDYCSCLTADSDFNFHIEEVKF